LNGRKGTGNHLKFEGRAQKISTGKEKEKAPCFHRMGLDLCFSGIG
jgi:hypothetical protein